MKSNLGSNDKVGWSTELARRKVTAAPDPALVEESTNDGLLLSGGGIGGVDFFFSGALGTGLVGIGGITDDEPESRTSADDEDDCVDPAGVALEGIPISALPRAV